MWLPGRAVASVTARYVPAGTALRVRGSPRAARSVSRWLGRQGFDARPEAPEDTDGAAPALVVLGTLDDVGVLSAAAALADGGRLVIAGLRPRSRRAAMDLTSSLAHAGFVRVGQDPGSGWIGVRVTFGVLRKLPERKTTGDAAS